MMHYAVHNQFGEILRSGAAPEDMVMDQAGEGEYIVLAPANDRDHYIVDGQVCAYTAQEKAAKESLPHGWQWKMPERVAVDARALDAAIAKTVRAIDQLADKARLAVVGDAARIKEYERAQTHAEQYRNAGFAGPVPQSVASWSKAKKWSAQAAAEDILAASERWYAALDGIRDLRLNAKEDAKRAGSNSAVDAILANFTAALYAAMQGVQ